MIRRNYIALQKLLQLGKSTNAYVLGFETCTDKPMANNFEGLTSTTHDFSNNTATAKRLNSSAGSHVASSHKCNDWICYISLYVFELALTRAMKVIAPKPACGYATASA